MARVPERLRDNPAYAELRILMQKGLCSSAAVQCPTLRASPRVREVLENKKATPAAQAQALIEIIKNEIATGEATAVLGPKSLRRLFPEGERDELLTEAREDIREAESFSDSTLSRREFAVCSALIACLGLFEPESVPPQTGETALDRRIAKLGGDWFALWETRVHGTRNFNMELLVVEIAGTHLMVRNAAPSPHNPEGYLWTGMLEPIRPRLLVGTYSAIDPDLDWSGSLCYQVGAAGSFMEGRWVGINVDLPLASGVSVLARDQDVARRRFASLIGGSRIPRLGANLDKQRT